MRRRTLLASAAALIATLIPSAVAAANPVVTNIDIVDDTGRRSEVVVTAQGMPIVASWDATRQRVDVIHCETATCDQAHSRRAVARSGLGIFDIAMAPDGLPVLAVGSNTGVHVIKCQNEGCTRFHAPVLVGPVNFAGTFASSVFMDVSIDVLNDGSPVVAYSEGFWNTAGAQLVVCRDPKCASYGRTPVGGGSSGITVDVAVGLNNAPEVVWGINNQIELMRCKQTACSSVTRHALGDGHTPSIDADAKYTSVVWIRNGNIRKFDCASSSCSRQSAPSGTGVVTVNVQTVGNGQDIVTYWSNPKGKLYVAECPTWSCNGREELFAGAGGSWTTLGIEHGPLATYVSFPIANNADLGLALLPN